ncbi:hypothetical protein IGL98_000667 [Enterococcus sp. DIV0840]|uniref:glucosaminidase domain-containing protein n=1 Tax=unclassified Enterococcus TaxID=2608891 RepID=UPI001A8D6081|nr:glucosaminidase domain-containing protein [Enterococcus sp. DIV0849a]MBO0434601.1 glucosaminidase domain-containing protein [Enterococcus sp. DIV0849a]
MKHKIFALITVSLLSGTSVAPTIAHGVESEKTDTTMPVEKATETSKSEKSEQQEETQTSESTENTTEISDVEQPVVTQESSTDPTDVSVEESSTYSEAETTIAILPIQEDISVSWDGTTDDFIQRIGEHARKIGQKHSLYASVMIAQAILESGSGSSHLSVEPYFNLFGIKGDFAGESVFLPTYEDDGAGNWYQIYSAFRQYPSYTETFEDYAKLIREGIEGNSTIYAGVWKENTETYQEATQSLTGVYATDTQYNQKLNALIEEYELTKYDQAQATTGSGIIVTDSHPDSDFERYSGENYSGAEYYASGNCTQYAYNRIVQLGGYLDVNMGNGMDWAQTGTARIYKVTNTPKAGTAVSFQPGVAGADSTYGHVAFVEHVYEDGSILISEMNAVGEGIVSFRAIDQQTATILSYVTPK